MTGVARREPAPAGRIVDAERSGIAAAVAAMKTRSFADDFQTGPVIDATLVAGLKPEYPVLARRRGYEGRVVVLASVRSSGAVARASVVESSGYRVLDAAALTAVKRWRLLPARRAGVAVKGSIEIPFDFVLQ
jgi:protein TonB